MLRKNTSKHSDKQELEVDHSEEKYKKGGVATSDAQVQAGKQAAATRARNASS